VISGQDDDSRRPAVDAIQEALRTGRRPEAADELAPEVLSLVDELGDISRFAMALSKGDLDQSLHRPGLMAGALKGLQGALRHVSWQAQRVASGDLSQRVDFMGEFAEAFNLMVEALADARATMEAQNARLEELATTDALTGVWNRRKFNELVGAELRRAQRYGAALSLCILDVDHFKRVNDTFGHDAGDAVLRELSDLARGEIREVDSLARWGGEEFVVLTPDVPVAGCAELAERIRTACAAHVFPAVGRVTVSIGVTGLSAGDTADALFVRADGALYRAKQGGRNRVETVA
jgi:diguanylate cyclase (GGDEF)-like protein